ncbi:hypothetical protein DDE83_004188 [Stemphylium lycopersici]|uniref:Uncharacterized protein n=1 Tax=Stemphylium lycopersici TaxID=183478 RepID=A0A364N5A4_STELY|nr:hypothetical protein DDE83_004188 [Stemphylium lycopersici]
MATTACTCVMDATGAEAHTNGRRIASLTSSARAPLTIPLADLWLFDILPKSDTPFPQREKPTRTPSANPRVRSANRVVEPTNTETMTPASSSFTPLNIPEDCVPEWLDSFILAAPPNTDLWRKPPTGDTSTAPVLYTALRAPFIAAEVRVSADWELEWDQGGLVIFGGMPPGLATATTTAAATITTPAAATTTTTTTTTTPATTTATTTATPAIEVPNIADILLEDSVSQTPAPSQPQNPTRDDNESFPNTPARSPEQESGTGAQLERGPPPPYAPPAPACKWVKVGLEFRNNVCHASSVVANSEGADWSLSALPPHQQRRYYLRVKIERIGYALWVWYEDEILGWKKLREVTWFFWGVEHKAVRVGVYASRPANFELNLFDRNHGTGGNNYASRNLCVAFDGLEIY